MSTKRKVLVHEEVHLVRCPASSDRCHYGRSSKVVDDKLRAQRGWKCTEAKMALADREVMYMHALPADRNNEVENSVIDGPHSIVYDEAENRLHTAKAVMTLLMGGR